MEAILLAGGKAERLGKAAGGRPKPLVPVAGRPLAAYQVARLSAAGVGRVIVACAAGNADAFRTALAGLGPEIVAVEEPEPLGRGGALRHASAMRREQGPVYALNGDELIDVDFGALAAKHEAEDAAATITVTPLVSAFGVVELDGDVVAGFREAPRLPYWVSCGVYVLGPEALERLPERGDHERSTFPELTAGRRLRAYRHDGLWLTVNTPKELRVAEEHVAAHPEWLAP
jgi:NDP-sugar pyrophosphorylase family protein